MSVDVAFFTNPGLASSKTRGEQIAERLGAPINKSFELSNIPKHLVFVKTFPENDLPNIPESTTVWLDPIDSDYGLERLASNPRVNVIAISDSAERYLKARIRNRIVKIREPHCNFERIKRPQRPVQVVGFVGYRECFDYKLEDVEAALKNAGLRFIWLLVNERTTRQDVVEFYKQIDIQVTFRGPKLVQHMPPEMKNPLKVINAASFGIPTVGFPELSYEEFPVSIPVHDGEELVIGCDRLRRTGLPRNLSLQAEPYHIEHIIEQYKEIFT